jgi:O-antigen/teichoic acid export membrane protein
VSSPETSPAPEGPSTASATAGYGRGAGILSAGLAATGLVTFGFFALASHTLAASEYKRIVLLWSLMFIVISTIYRPIEQLLSRTIAARRATGIEEHPLRGPAAIQLGFAAVFLAVALALRGRIENELFDGSATLYWVLVAGVATYGAAFFARGWLAGHKRFGLFGALVLLDAVARFCFPLAVAFGVGGETLIAIGIAAAPLISLAVVPPALAMGRARRSEGEAARLALAAEAALEGPGSEGAEEAMLDFSLTRGAGFAVAVLGIFAAEQALLNVPVLTVDASSNGAALAGFVFNVLLIARAPLQLFQAVQLSLLPHLAGLEATEGREAFRHAVRVTALAIAAFGAAVAVGLFAIGPPVMRALFGGGFDYARGGLALMGLGMGFHLFAGTLNQAALARGRHLTASGAWILVAGLFLAWLLAAPVSDQILRVETGYCGGTALLSLALLAVLRGRRGAAAHS